MTPALRRFGPFWLEARLAVGGTAEVYIAHAADPHSGLPGRLVVKRLLPHMLNEPDALTMFDREAKIHAAIEHENVVKVFFSGAEESTGEPYLALEFVDGVDGYRLLRRLRQEGKTLPMGIAVHIAREVLLALASAHSARDPSGKPLHIVHRDVSPSNIYLSVDGRIKLGDFGIAHWESRHGIRPEASNNIKGKYAYLAPEQVAGEEADHRADLFSMAAVLAEMLLGQPLFGGGGQLAVLLAIRDCNIDLLEAARSRLPKGLFDVLERALARDPARRFATASELAARLAPFETSPRVATSELAVLVKLTQSADAASREMKAIREELPPPAEPVQSPIADDASSRKTSEYMTEPSFILTPGGQRRGPLSFGQLIEALATGEVTPEDQVDYVGTGMRPLLEIEQLVRFLPPSSATVKGAVPRPEAPDFAGDLPELSMVSVLARVLRSRETGVLLAERPGASGGASTRKELYFVNARLRHVASSNANELLGEYLVRRQRIAREELDLALAVLPRYDGRMGDTLIALGLVDPVEVFRAIREQGRDRVADLFTWKRGRVSFYSGRSVAHVEFPLELDLAQLMVAGLEAEIPGDSPLERYRSHMGRTLRRRAVDADTAPLVAVTWPPTISRVLMLLERAQPLRNVVKSATRSSHASAADILRAVEILVVTRLVAFDP